ncbi:hypothetical protein L249_1804 [Ophiocordyceps polyrhachis-furcata BCC 54312]|uniref:Uncharacterized protein n=1 Tax=Ophiocordyceps polyrhachis-furcata BCC 54312 TaxID=1330021 RepID=A0A367LRW8_9HYPO|nr:hypothetical protein L249_1804 [Ophiocordyceps polyrhachis-furcata BCC 54312]
MLPTSRHTIGDRWLTVRRGRFHPLGSGRIEMEPNSWTFRFPVYMHTKDSITFFPRQSHFVFFIRYEFMQTYFIYTCGNRRDKFSISEDLFLFISFSSVLRSRALCTNTKVFLMSFSQVCYTDACYCTIIITPVRMLTVGNRRMAMNRTCMICTYACRKYHRAKSALVDVTSARDAIHFGLSPSRSLPVLSGCSPKPRSSGRALPCLAQPSPALKMATQPCKLQPTNPHYASLICIKLYGCSGSVRRPLPPSSNLQK